MPRLALAAAILLALPGCASSGAVGGVAYTPGEADILVLRHFVRDPSFVGSALETDGFRRVVGGAGAAPTLLQEESSGGAYGVYERTSTLLADRPVHLVVVVRRGSIRGVLAERDTYSLVIAEEETAPGEWRRIPLGDPAQARFVRSLSAVVGLEGSRVLGVTDAAGQISDPVAVR